MITLVRFSVFTLDQGHGYDVVMPVDMTEELIAKVAEEIEGVDTIEEALFHVLEDVGIAEPVIEFDEVFQAETINGNMTQDDIPAIVLGATPPDDAEWVEDVNAAMYPTSDREG